LNKTAVYVSTIVKICVLHTL